VDNSKKLWQVIKHNGLKVTTQYTFEYLLNVVILRRYSFKATNSELLIFKTEYPDIKISYKGQNSLEDIKYTFIEVFVFRPYKFLDVKRKNVVDIGANVADSAIYFALNGANHVYAYEPYPSIYKMAKENIRLNKLEGKTSMFNEGVGGKRESMMINTKAEGAESVIKNSHGGTKIKIVKLSDIVKLYKLKNAILKCDCEGYEYEIIENADRNTLRAFDQIQIEYHHGIKSLTKILKEAGFEVKYTRPIPGLLIKKENFKGYIYAWRKN